MVNKEMLAEQALNGLTLLSVDDELSNNEIIRRTFRPFTGCQVLTTSSADEALKILSEHSVDVLLVDQSMPEMKGVEFLEKARTLAPDAVSVMVTGYPELDEVANAQDRGIVGRIVPKPWRPRDLIEAVRRAVIFRS